jgi:phosphate:Na+ symporter
MALMTGMDLMSEAMSFLKHEAWFAELMVSFSNPILGIIAGALLTAVLQSSSASVGILQSLCATGAVTFGTVLPIILGQNIGTCVTAMISTVGANRNARRTALVHLYFNLVGVAIFALVFYGVGLIFPWPFMESTAEPMTIALIHTGFNVGATLVLLPLHKLLEKLAYMTIPAEPIHQAPVLLDERLLATPAVAIQRAQEITGRMASDALEAMKLAASLTREFSEEGLAQVKELEDQTDRYQDALGSYLVKLTGQQLSDHDNKLLNTLLYSLSDIERMADHAVTIAKAGQEMAQKQIRFSDAACRELEVLERAVIDTVRRTANAFGTGDLSAAVEIEPMEQVVDALVKDVKSGHVRRLRDGLCTVEYGFVLDDLLTSFERIADHCSNVAVEMIQSASDKMDAHEYLNALKAGQLEESEKYNQRLAKYKARYAFPEEK